MPRCSEYGTEARRYLKRREKAMKRIKKVFIAIMCLLLCASFAACARGGVSGGSGGNENNGGNGTENTGNGGEKDVIEDVDFSARDTVEYLPDFTAETFEYGGEVYSATAASQFTEVVVNPWEKNVKFTFVAEEKSNSNHGYANFLAAATEGCAGGHMRYNIPGVKIHENYAQFYNRWTTGSTTFQVQTKGGKSVTTGVPYEVTIGFGNVKKNGVIQNYKIYLKMKDIAGDILLDGTYLLAVNTVDGAPFDYSTESTTNVPAVGFGYWDKSIGSKHRILSGKASAANEFVIHYELPEGRTETLAQTQQTVKYGEAFQLFIPDIVGFEKWVYKDGEHAGEEFTDGIYSQKHDIYLVAVFTDIDDNDKNRGEFDDNGGFTTPDVPNISEPSDGEDQGEFDGDGGFTTPDVPSVGDN